MPDPNAGCIDSRCCFSIPDDFAACFHVADLLGFNYLAEMDGVNRLDCWAGISQDESDADQSGCNKCDNGCFDFKDDLIALMLGSLWTGSRAYMQSSPSHRWGRDAKNQIFDLRADSPVLIHRLCAMEASSCFDAGGVNTLHPDGLSCWGFHVCQCTPGPDTGGDPCETALPGFAVSGQRGMFELFNHNGWPPGTQGVTSDSELFCRKFIPFGPEQSQRNFFFFVHQNSKNAVFLHERKGMGADVLVPCAAFRADSTCQHDAGAGAGDDCVYVGDTRNVGAPIFGGPQYFDEVWIDIPNTDMKLRAKPTDTPSIVREKQLHADVIREILGRVFPTGVSPPTVTFDRISVFSQSNIDVGNYIRSWDGTTLDEIDLPLLIEFQHSYTRFGRVPVDARMVAIKASIKLKLTIPRYTTYVPPSGNLNLNWLRRYGYFEIDVETAMQVTPFQSSVTIGGEPLAVVTPPWLGIAGYGGLIPTATPEENRIVYARELDANGRPLPVRVARKWRWVGRLGSFSDPVAEDTDRPNDGWDCKNLVGDVGVFFVPGLATANEDRPNDPNQNYDGQISFFFVVAP